ncbi:hypothetical protein ACS0TY_018299 [Phlomoides rotata]
MLPHVVPSHRSPSPSSDTGGFSAGTGLDADYPYGGAFFHPPIGRATDDRLVIEVCESTLPKSLVIAK